MNLHKSLEGRFGNRLLAKDQTQSIWQDGSFHDDGGPSGKGVNFAVCAERPLYLLRQLLMLDGSAGSILLISPSLPASSISALMQDTDCSILLSDRTDLQGMATYEVPLMRRDSVTRWLLTTSGTTGMPKVVEHTLESITASTKVGSGSPEVKWGLLFEMSRFAGLQVVMQSLLGGGTLLAPAGNNLAERIDFLVAEGCTHLSATPTLWRKLLMSPNADRLRLRQITCGGEIADEGLLGALGQAHPDARITHIYASTEIGVGFPVNDGKAGFPAAMLHDAGTPQMKVVDGVLWAKPDGARASIAAKHIDRDVDGYVCTGDRVKIEGDRVLFLGRESSLVNIGGMKVQIEEVEKIVRECPAVADCILSAKKNPITGAILALTVSAAPGLTPETAKGLIKDWCRQHLPREAQPATVKVVDAIDIAISGKISRVVN